MNHAPYRWRCLACETGNSAASEQCANCGCPAWPRYAQIERCARLALLRSDKIFPPANADLTLARGRRRSPLEAACIVVVVLSSWAVVAGMIRLSMAPVAGGGVGAWVLKAMMVTVVILAVLTSVIVYRSARRERTPV